MKKIISGLLLIISSYARAQEQHMLSLAESKEAALAYSRTIKNRNLAVTSSEAGKKVAGTNYYPTVQAGGGLFYGFTDFVKAIPPQLPGNIDNFYFAGVTATELLYAGGRIRNASALAALQVEVDRIRAQQSTDSVYLLTEQKYWNLIHIQEQYKTYKANATVLREILQLQENMLAQGLIARNALLKVKVQQSKLILDESRLDNLHKVALLDLCLYIGRPYDSLLVMKDSFPLDQTPSIGPASPDMELSGNTDYRLAQQSLSAEKLQTELVKANNRPVIGAGLSAGQFGVIGNGVGGKFSPMTFGVVNIPISNWWGKGKHQLKQRQLSEQITRNGVEDVKDRLTISILQTWYELVDARNQIALAKDNLDLATENLKENRDNYGSGLASITELLDAQAQMQQAESDQKSAYAAFYARRAAYRYITGVIR